MYEYKAKVKKIVDGDTIAVEVDLGFELTQVMVLRLYGLNTPEIVGVEREKGLEAKQFVQDRLPIGKEVIVKTFKDKKEKYGRYLAEVIFDNQSLNQLLLNSGIAQPL